jgi:hypothetical protein
MILDVVIKGRGRHMLTFPCGTETTGSPEILNSQKHESQKESPDANNK